MFFVDLGMQVGLSRDKPDAGRSGEVISVGRSVGLISGELLIDLVSQGLALIQYSSSILPVLLDQEDCLLLLLLLLFPFEDTIPWVEIEGAL